MKGSFLIRFVTPLCGWFRGARRFPTAYAVGYRTYAALRLIPRRAPFSHGLSRGLQNLRRSAALPLGGSLPSLGRIHPGSSKKSCITFREGLEREEGREPRSGERSVALGISRGEDPAAKQQNFNRKHSSLCRRLRHIIPHAVEMVLTPYKYPSTRDCGRGV